MQSLRKIFLSKGFLLSIAFIFGIQFCLLLLATPLYELDTNSYIQGMFTWSIYHNPFTNLFIGGLSKVWKNLWFILSFQLLIYSVCASIFIWSLKLPQKLLRIGLLLAAIEPVTSFYNVSLISDSSFTSFVLLFSGLLIFYLRNPGWKLALLFGGAIGLAFLSRLSANIFLPLFGLFLLIPKRKWLSKFRDLAYAIIPFVFAYLFVFIGQSLINDGGLYTVKGRVLWDFTSSQYDSEDFGHSEFQNYVNPYILQKDSLVEDRETRRELAYLGYKDCQSGYEAKGLPVNQAILKCDSIWGAAAQTIKERHFSAAAKQFLMDNLADIHSKNYLEYRFTPDLHFYHSEAENHYIDSVMKSVYGYSLKENHDKIPGIWKSTAFLNIYIPILYWFLGLAGLLATFLWIRSWKRWEMLVPGLVIGIPFLFHLVYISYRLRFIAPYLVIGIGLVLVLINHFWKPIKSSSK